MRTLLRNTLLLGKIGDGAGKKGKDIIMAGNILYLMLCSKLKRQGHKKQFTNSLCSCNSMTYNRYPNPKFKIGIQCSTQATERNTDRDHTALIRF